MDYSLLISNLTIKLSILSKLPQRSWIDPILLNQVEITKITLVGKLKEQLDQITKKIRKMIITQITNPPKKHTTTKKDIRNSHILLMRNIMQLKEELNRLKKKEDILDLLKTDMTTVRLIDQLSELRNKKMIPPPLILKDPNQLVLLAKMLPQE